MQINIDSQNIKNYNRCICKITSVPQICVVCITNNLSHIMNYQRSLVCLDAHKLQLPGSALVRRINQPRARDITCIMTTWSQLNKPQQCCIFLKTQKFTTLYCMFCALQHCIDEFIMFLALGQKGFANGVKLLMPQLTKQVGILLSKNYDCNSLRMDAFRRNAVSQQP